MNKPFKPIKFEDFNLTDAEAKNFAQGSRYLFGSPPQPVSAPPYQGPPQPKPTAKAKRAGLGDPNPFLIR